MRHRARSRSRTLVLAVAFVLAILPLACDGGGGDHTEGPWSGTFEHDVTWRDAVTVSGDLIFLPGTTLTIEPGTTVTVLADQDDRGLSHLGPVDDLTKGDPTHDPGAGGEAFQKTHVSILIQGRVLARGTAERPIVFRSSSPSPRYTDWDGIQYAEGTWEHVVIEWALNPLYASTDHGDAVLEDVRISHAWAACTGFQRPRAGARSSVTHATLEDCGHEAIDTHSPGNLTVAWTRIRASQAGLNLHDDATVSAHHLVITDTAFPILSVSASNVFVTQAVLQAAPQDSTRWAYQGYTMPRLQGAAAVFVPPNPGSHVVVVNSILFRSPVGLRNEAEAGALGSGFLGFDRVDEPFQTNAQEGDGTVNASAGFVDEAAGDFRLVEGSAMRGRGNPADGSPDLGAFGGKDADPQVGSRH